VADRCFAGGGGFGRPRRALTTLALSLLLAGCYTYTEVSPAAVPPGGYVRAHLEPGSRLSMGSVPLPEGRRMIGGTLLGGGPPDTLLFSVALSGGDPMSPSRRLRGTVPVPTGDVRSLELRRLDKVRTGASVGLGAVVAAAVLDWAFNITQADQNAGEPGGGANNAPLVLFRLRW